MAKTVSTAKVSLTVDLACWYKKYRTTVFCTLCSDLKKHLSIPTVDKALVLLWGDIKLARDNHMWYLWRFPKNHPSRDELLRRINSSSLWAMSFTGIANFEDLYDNVWKTINTPKITFVGQLVIYDISLHLACLEGTGRLMPKDIVYIHALPLRPYNVLISTEFLPSSSFKKNEMKIEYLRLSHYFPGLTAYEIEDLFCQLGKSMRRIIKSRSPKNIEEKEIDKIVSRYMILP